MVGYQPRTGFYNVVHADLFGEDWLEEVEFPEETIEHVAERLLEDGSAGSEEEAREMALDELYEALQYCLWYYESSVIDVKTALKCSLVPFQLRGFFFLALGGCGMDLSPKLDAYQVLTAHTIDPDSKFIHEPEYARYVVGEEVFKEVMDIITPLLVAEKLSEG